MTLDVIKKGDSITKIDYTVNKISMTPRGEFHPVCTCGGGERLKKIWKERSNICFPLLHLLLSV